MDDIELKYNKCRYCRNNPYAKNGKKIVTGANRYSAFYTDKKAKEEISQYWSITLNNLLDSCIEIKEEDFFRNVEELKKAIETKSKGKIAHFTFYDALRSFSVALKYRWCDEKSSTKYKEPPLCPISEPVLSRLNEDFEYLNRSNITKEDSERIYAFIRVEAEKEGLTISQWELKHFNLYQAEQHGL